MRGEKRRRKGRGGGRKHWVIRGGGRGGREIRVGASGGRVGKTGWGGREGKTGCGRKARWFESWKERREGGVRKGEGEKEFIPRG